MNFQIDKDMLLKSVSIADSIIASKNVNTILGNCLFNVSKDNLEIISTDNEIAIRTNIDVVADSNFSFTANGKRLAQILKELPKGEVELSVNESFLINMNSLSKDIKGKYKIVGTSNNDYPDVPEVNIENSIEINQSILKDMIRKVVYAAATDSIKPVFNGLFFLTDNNSNLTAVASDSRRLSLVTRNIESNIDLGEGIIIPLKTIHEISRLLSIGTCTFSIKGNQCFFKIGNTEIISRLIEGNYPNYKQVIPKEKLFEASVDHKKFIETVRRIMIFTKEPVYKVLLNFDSDKLNVEAKTAEYGEADEDLAISKDSSEKITIGINSQYVMDCVKEINDDNIKIGITGEMSPVTFTSENDENFVSIVMPIQLKNAD